MRTSAPPRSLSKKRSRLDGNRDREYALSAICSDDELDDRPLDNKALEETLPAEVDDFVDANPEEIFGDDASAEMTSAADIAAAVMAQMNPVLDTKLRTLDASIDQKLWAYSNRSGRKRSKRPKDRREPGSSRTTSSGYGIRWS